MDLLSEWENFKGTRIPIFLSYPNQVRRLQENNKEDKVYNILQNWIEEENIIPKLELKHEMEIKEKEKEIKRLTTLLKTTTHKKP